MRDDLVILILSHGRAKSLAQHTVHMLERCRYSGPWFILLDTDDKSAPEYVEEFGFDRIKYFRKDDSLQDMGDNGGHPGVVVQARNESGRLARELGYRYYMQLDDDYTDFQHRYEGRKKSGAPQLTGTSTRRLDDVLDALLEFLEVSGAHTIAMSQGGDLIGGLTSINWRKRLLRKAMNTFIARTEDPIHFVGRINEDVNTYVTQSMRGLVFFTFMDFQIVQVQTQKSPGGLTDAYLDKGTYTKSFYTVMMAPSAVKVSTMGVHGHRIHHHIKWAHTAPKILSDRYRRSRPAPVPSSP